MVLTLIVAGLQEEVIYRGMMVTLLLPYGWLLALLVSATFFTLVHFVTSPVTWRQTVNWFVGGISLFIIFVVSHSVLVATSVHVARNLANSFLLVTVPGVSIAAPDKPLSEHTRLIYYSALSTLVTVLAVLWYARPG
jgi:membrane protease YdiL (CAAX protease family)